MSLHDSLRLACIIKGWMNEYASNVFVITLAINHCCLWAQLAAHSNKPQLYTEDFKILMALHSISFNNFFVTCLALAEKTWQELKRIQTFSLINNDHIFITLRHRPVRANSFTTETHCVYLHAAICKAKPLQRHLGKSSISKGSKVKHSEILSAASPGSSCKCPRRWERNRNQPLNPAPWRIR